MTSDPHLLTEDRPEFDRILDQALRALPAPPDGHPHRLNSEQLRTLAREAAAAISATAAEEYAAYQRIRELERTARTAVAPPPAPRAARDGGPVRSGMGEALSGAGLFPVVAVLTPVLAGAAAVIFLAVGYLLAAVSPEPSIAAPLRTAGWLFLAIAAFAVLSGAVGMVLTARRDGAGAIRASRAPESARTAAARGAWTAALLERGMLPFLRDAQERGPGASDAPRPRTSPPLGYSRPGFSSPAGGAARTTGPRYSSPDFSSPTFSSPTYSSSDLSSPDGRGRPHPDPTR